MNAVAVRQLDTARPDFEDEFRRVRHWSAETDAAEPLRDHLVAGLETDIEIRQHNLSRRGRVAAGRDHVEAQRRDDVVAGFVAGRVQVGDRRGHVDRIGSETVGRIEERDVAGTGNDARDRAGAAADVHAPILEGTLAVAGRKEGENHQRD